MMAQVDAHLPPKLKFGWPGSLDLGPLWVLLAATIAAHLDRRKRQGKSITAEKYFLEEGELTFRHGLQPDQLSITLSEGAGGLLAAGSVEDARHGVLAPAVPHGETLLPPRVRL